MKTFSLSWLRRKLQKLLQRITWKETCTRWYQNSLVRSNPMDTCGENAEEHLTLSLLGNQLAFWGITLYEAALR